jgi:hypothetical protein
LIPGDLVQLNDLLYEDITASKFGVIVRELNAIDDFELFGICDWWVMRNDAVEPWPATEFVVVNATG